MRNASALESLGSAEISWSMFQISSHLPQKKRGVNFNARPTGSDATSSRFRFPGDLGSSCRSWDHGRHPDCHKEEQPGWCHGRNRESRAHRHESQCSESLLSGASGSGATWTPARATSKSSQKCFGCDVAALPCPAHGDFRFNVKK